MWKLDSSKETVGAAHWESDSAAWSIEAFGGDAPFRVSGGPSVSKNLKQTEICRFCGVDESLPPAVEEFIRGNEFHVRAPQKDGAFGVRMTFESIATDFDVSILEVTVAVQTSLLDSHPMVDLIVDGDHSTGDQSSTDSPSISVVGLGDSEVAVLLDRHDSPFTANRSDADGLKLRLFGDFLEKGVIRKARPWLVYAPTGKLEAKQLQALLDQLNNSPLPLTP